MLHSEEKGAGLSNPPREIYESLFQKHYGKHVIEITSASKKKPVNNCIRLMAIVLVMFSGHIF